MVGTDDGMLGVMNSSPCFYWLSLGFLPLCKAGSKEIKLVNSQTTSNKSNVYTTDTTVSLFITLTLHSSTLVSLLQQHLQRTRCVVFLFKLVCATLWLFLLNIMLLTLFYFPYLLQFLRLMW